MVQEKEEIDECLFANRKLYIDRILSPKQVFRLDNKENLMIIIFRKLSAETDLLTKLLENDKIRFNYSC